MFWFPVTAGSQFYQVTNVPTKKQLEKLIGLAVSVGSEVCMKNHVYTIDGEIRRQLNGGAIESVLIGDNARLFMMRWDNKFKRKLKALGIKLKLYLRYVDDTWISIELADIFIFLLGMNFWSNFFG